MNPAARRAVASTVDLRRERLVEPLARRYAVCATTATGRSCERANSTPAASRGVADHAATGTRASTSARMLLPAGDDDHDAHGHGPQNTRVTRSVPRDHREQPLFAVEVERADRDEHAAAAQRHDQRWCIRMVRF